MIPQLRWATLHPAAAAAVVFSGLFAAAVLPHITAQVLVAGIYHLPLSRLNVVQLAALWNSNTLQGLYSQEASSADVDVQIVSATHWVIVWAVEVLLVAAATTVTLVWLRRQANPQHKQGLASVTEVCAELGEKQLLRRAPLLRPSLEISRVHPTDVGFRVGEFLSVGLWLRMEDPTIIIGPARAGKGWYFVLNWIIAAPGAVITTSSKMDNVLMTMRARQRRGSRVWIFAPGIAGGDGLGHVLAWDFIDGCIDEATLVRRVKALIPSDSFSGSTSNGGHWDTLGQQLAAHLIHAAACAGADVDVLWSWVASPERARAAVSAIRSHDHGMVEHAHHLEEVINMPPEQRATQWSVLPTVLAFLESRTARAWLKPDQSSQINMVEFFLGKGTLYLIGDKASAAGYVRIIDGLLAELDYVSKGLADATPSGRLDPPVSYILDEAGNFTYQGLPELITAGGGRGRVGVAVFQSKSQLEGWGVENAKTLWDAAPAKILLPGGGDARELGDFSDLVGSHYIRRESHTFGHNASPSVSVSEERRAVLEAKEIRELPAGFAIVFYRHLKPLIAKLSGFHTQPDFHQFNTDAKELAALMKEQSPFASAINDFHSSQKLAVNLSQGNVSEHSS